MSGVVVAVLGNWEASPEFGRPTRGWKHIHREFSKPEGRLSDLSASHRGFPGGGGVVVLLYPPMPRPPHHARGLPLRRSQEPTPSPGLPLLKHTGPECEGPECEPPPAPALRPSCCGWDLAFQASIKHHLIRAALQRPRKLKQAPRLIVLIDLPGLSSEFLPSSFSMTLVFPGVVFIWVRGRGACCFGFFSASH